MTEPKLRSRILILSHIAQFSLSRRYGDQAYGGLSDMAFVAGDRAVIPGDLVVPQSAPPSKWYLGWLISKQWPEGHACETYTIESIEDGELGDWSNIGIIHYDRSQVANHPEWRWTDAQHEFNDRWKRVCKDERDAYMYLPAQPTFYPDNGVSLGVRVRFGLSDLSPSRIFGDWREISQAMMLEFYDEAVEIVRAEKVKP